MNIATIPDDITSRPDWPDAIYRTLKDHVVSQISYVPDAGHSRLIELAHADPAIKTTVLTTEEEGVALSAGAWLGGDRAVLLMQSSGVGNCVNMLSLLSSCRFPLLTLVTMRGEWAEFNPWQIPMGKATAQAFEVMGVTVFRLEQPEDATEMVRVACVRKRPADRDPDLAADARPQEVDAASDRPPMMCSMRATMSAISICGARWAARP